MCVSYGIIEGLTRISRILFRCKQRVFSFGLNGKTPKDSGNPGNPSAKQCNPAPPSNQLSPAGRRRLNGSKSN